MYSTIDSCPAVAARKPTVQPSRVSPGKAPACSRHFRISVVPLSADATIWRTEYLHGKDLQCLSNKFTATEYLHYLTHAIKAVQDIQYA
jgi:hypothetical protein